MTHPIDIATAIANAPTAATDATTPDETRPDSLPSLVAPQRHASLVDLISQALQRQQDEQASAAQTARARNSFD